MGSGRSWAVGGCIPHQLAKIHFGGCLHPFFFPGGTFALERVCGWFTCGWSRIPCSVWIWVYLFSGDPKMVVFLVVSLHKPPNGSEGQTKDQVQGRSEIPANF